MKVSESERLYRLELYAEAKRKGVTMTFLSEVCGVSLSLVSKYFNSVCNVNSSTEDLIIQTIKQAKKFTYEKVKVYVDE